MFTTILFASARLSGIYSNLEQSSRFAIGGGCLVREDDVSEDLKFFSDAAMIGVSMGIDMDGS